MEKRIINGKTVIVNAKGIVQPISPGSVDREKTVICPPRPITWRVY